MRPVRPTSLARMREAAYERMATIESSDDARIAACFQLEPNPEQEELRDDFAGIVRLLDALIEDPDLAATLGGRTRI